MKIHIYNIMIFFKLYINIIFQNIMYVYFEFIYWMIFFINILNLLKFYLYFILILFSF